jgi:threonine/homoserine/homoserine lactone efflux protein
MILLLTSGIILGVTSGITPGPLLTFIISQTFNYGFKEGAKAAVVPLITDLPIIAIAFLIAWRFDDVGWLPGLLSFAGAGFITYLAWGNLRFNPIRIPTAAANAKSMLKGTLINLLNPSPYFFWMTVGVPFLSKTWTAKPIAAAAWVMGFYIALIGSKLMLAALVNRMRSFLNSQVYLWINRGLGLVLLFFAAMLVKIGIDFILTAQ